MSDDPEDRPTNPPPSPDAAEPGVSRVLAAVERLQQVSQEYANTVCAALAELKEDVEEQYERLATTSDQHNERLKRIEQHLGLPPLDGDG